MLDTLIEKYGISGFETPVSDYIKETLAGICDSVQEDKMGNIIATKKGDGSLNPVLLAVYMDEPGIIVTKITEDGYLKFEIVGRMKPEQLTYQRVNIQGVIGVIALKAVHLSTKEEREKSIGTEQLVIDIGVDTRQEAEEYVTVGDFGVIESDSVLFGNEKQKGKALAGRLGCFTALSLLQNTNKADLEVVFAVQREIGCRGIQVALNQCRAKKALVLDGYYDTDTIAIGHRSFQKDKDTISLIAKKEGISVLVKVLEKGQEGPILESGKMEQLLCLSIPVQHAHSAYEVVKKEYIGQFLRLAECYINGGNEDGMDE